MSKKMFLNHFGRFENVECGLVHYLSGSGCGDENERKILPKIIGVPLRSVSIQATVVHAVTKVELTQVYQNDENRSLEVLYYFPLDPNGGVTHFHAELEGRIIKGVIKSKEDALAAYDRAIGQRETAFPQEPNRPNTFKVRVGVLKAGREVTVVIHYVTQVKNDRGTNGIGFSIPSTLVPRYISSQGAEPPRASLSVTVNVKIQGKIKEISSTTHDIDIERKGGSRRGNWSETVVKLEGRSTAEMTGNFELQIIPEDIYAPRLYAERFGNSTAMMAHYIPTFKAPKQKVELIFLLDRSGSMMEFSIELAKRALTLFLHSLPVDCYFNIVCFGYTFEFLFNQSRRYDDESLRQAIEYTEGLTADMGGTEILPPLEAIFNQDLIRGYNRQIFVLTDGAVENTEDVINLCRSNAKTTRVFSLGIGHAVSHPLVEGIARVAGGTATFVVNNDAFESEVLQHLANAVEHSLTNMRVKWLGLPEEEEYTRPISPVAKGIGRVRTLVGQVLEPIAARLSPTPPLFLQNDPSLQTPPIQVPPNVGPIFDGQQMVVFGLFSGERPTGVEVQADSPDGPVSFQIDAEESENGDMGLVHELATVRAIRQLEAKEAGLSRDDNQDKENLKERKELIKQIVNLSCTHGLVSKHTAYVAIDKVSGQQQVSDDVWVIAESGENKYAAGRWLIGRETFSYVHDDVIGGGVGGLPKSTTDVGNRRSLSPSLRFNTDSFNTPRTPSPRPGPTSPVQPVSPPRGVFKNRDRDVEVVPEYTVPRTITRRRTDGEERLHALITTQLYNGSFPLDARFSDAIGKSYPLLLEEARKMGWREQAWATALALTYLKQNLGHLRESWELVADKGRTWLQIYVRHDMDNILLAAQEYFNIGTVI